ncbi:glycoside hydrolase family 3 C-terminal domain-containing protein [Streptomyces canus]|uniref:glycoside hydrolase family 3 C-terminal domain-containing protein n=1 Tax=Streptomyces canus TaxID=58343 RepID=UPI003F4B9FCC
MAVASQADYVVAVVGDTVGLTGERPLHGDAGAHGESDRAPRRPPEARPAPRRRPDPGQALDAAHLGTRRGRIVQAFTPGMQGGRAIAELLLGRIEPSGRPPLGIPCHAGQPPVNCGQVRGITAASARASATRR